MNKLMRIISLVLLVALSTIGMSAEAQRRRTSRQRRPTRTTSRTQSRLTGTYRLDPTRSDDPRSMADRATSNLPDPDRQNVYDSLLSQLNSPDTLAIERRGNSISIASTLSPRLNFVADGIERSEQSVNGQTARVRTALNGEQLVVTSTGDRDSDFSVTFEPLDNGTRLLVTRRVTAPRLDRPVTLQSTYNRVSDVAQLNLYRGAQNTAYGGGPRSSDSFIVPNNTRLIAVLNDNLSTGQSHERDRFTLTVREPSQYQGATIDGYVSGINQSGKISGRSQMTLNFERIHLRDGSTYRFAGLVDGVRASGGQSVRVGNEGNVQSSSQTTKTEERAAIGTGAGGGKGAAIGAILGAGGGAGSVYVQGRQNLELRSGTEMTIRASAPR